jgi:hypothetical protein
MTGCVTGSSDDLMRRLDGAVEALVPAVGALLAELGRGDIVTVREDGGHALTVPVGFPDGIGEGAVTARVFRYRTSVRVDLFLRHNRVIALGDGRPTDRPCFLNDFVASVTLGPDATALPEKYVAQVQAGVRGALTAVEDHNRRYPQPWSRILVAAVELVTAAPER